MQKISIQVPTWNQKWSHDYFKALLGVDAPEEGQATRVALD